MANNNSFAEFFKGRVTPDVAATLESVDRLAGQSVGSASFYSGLHEVRNEIERWLPLFLLPIGIETFQACLHLRPSHVSDNRIAVIRANDEGEMIDIANSLEQFVYRALLEQEGWGHDEDKTVKGFPASVATANKVFGANFYEPGRHGKFKHEDVEQLMIKIFGGTANAFYTQALFSEKPEEQLSYLEKGITVDPGCLALRSFMVEQLVEIKDRRRAAEQLARSLDCYHYTAYATDIDKYLKLGRSLLAEFPDLFSEEQRWALTETNPRNWVRRAGELFDSGDAARADKILNDVCHGIQDYSSSVGAFRKHYEKLGWDWAIALCELREQ